MPSENPIAILITPNAPTSTRQIAQQSTLPQITREPTNGLYLLADTNGISLCKAGEKGRVQVEFTAGVAKHRREQGKGELIARAVNHKTQPTIWDATGGLGRDAFVLATLGLHVCLFEQHPAIACLLSDGIERAKQHPDTSEVAQRLILIQGDARQQMPLFARQTQAPEVIYLDPMYPSRQKSAAVKKEMAYFHQLITHTPDDDAQLLTCARQIAQKRIVVKRPRLGDNLAGITPHYCYEGKSTRFDVYLPFNTPDTQP